jgi:hypothetical protein
MEKKTWPLTIDCESNVVESFVKYLFHKGYELPTTPNTRKTVTEAVEALL